MKITRNQLKDYLEKRRTYPACNDETRPLTIVAGYINHTGNVYETLGNDKDANKFIELLGKYFKKSDGTVNETAIDNLGYMYPFDSEIMIKIIDDVADTLGRDDLFLGNMTEPVQSPDLEDVNCYFMVRKSSDSEYEIFECFHHCGFLFTREEMQSGEWSEWISTWSDCIYSAMYSSVCDKDTFLKEVVINK